MSLQDGFEQSIRNSLDQFEVPYNSADWSKMEEALNKEERSNGRGGFGLYAAVIAGALAIGAGTYWLAASGDTANDLTTVEHTADTEQQGLSEKSDLDGSNKTGTLVPIELNGVNSEPQDILENEVETTSDEVTEASNSDQSNTTAQLNTRSSSNTSKPKPVSGKANTSGKSGNKGDQADIAAVDQEKNEATNTEMSFSSTMTEGCPGSAVEFEVTNMPADGIYLWNFGDGSFSNKPNPSHVFDKPGSYQVNLSVTTASGGTILNKPASNKIDIFNAPRASFIHQNKETAGGVPHKHFENRSRNATKWNWSFGDGQTSTDEHPRHVYKQKGVYKVELIATNVTGCQDKYIREVVISGDYDLGAPLAFSPDGDGEMDSFMPEKLRDMKVPFKLSIYEETGRKVFETSNATIGWNGNVNNRSEHCAPGEYVWMVEFTEKKADVEETFNGKVTLLQ